MLCCSAASYIGAIMLREWIQNIPAGVVNAIINDPRVKGRSIWRIAIEECERRRQAA